MKHAAHVSKMSRIAAPAAPIAAPQQGSDGKNVTPSCGLWATLFPETEGNGRPRQRSQDRRQRSFLEVLPSSAESGKKLPLVGGVGITIGSREWKVGGTWGPVFRV